MPSRFLGGHDSRIAITALVVFAERAGEECGEFTPDVLAPGAGIEAGISLTPGRVARVFPGCGSEPVTGRLAVEAALRRRSIR